MPDIPAAATLVLTNGKIITVNPRNEIAQAVAISGERIIAVGGNAEIAPLVGKETRVVDLKGRAAMPGLVDGRAQFGRRYRRTGR